MFTHFICLPFSSVEVTDKVFGHPPMDLCTYVLLCLAASTTFTNPFITIPRKT